MTTPAPAPAATLSTAPAAPAKPDAAKAAAAMWRALCSLAPRFDARITAELAASDPGTVANLAHWASGGDPADIYVIAAYVQSEGLKP